MVLGNELTQLEQELHEKIECIKQFNVVPRYIPARVEPGFTADLNTEKDWSKFIGETLFINQNFLKDPYLRTMIFWREAFLLFAPKEIRNVWWIKALANTFPFCVKVENEQIEKWEELLLRIKESRNPNVYFFKKFALSVRTHGLLELLRQIIERIQLISFNTPKTDLERISSQFSLQELNIIKDKIYTDSIGISSAALEILKLALIKQSIKPTELENFTNSDRSYISKTLKKMRQMEILSYRKEINFNCFGLVDYLLVFNLERKQYTNLLKKIQLTPFIFSNRIHCLNTCTSFIHYLGPNNDTFYSKLKLLAQEMYNTEIVNRFNLFKVEENFANYNFKYFNPQTKTQNLEFTKIAIDYNLLSKSIEDNFDDLQMYLGNIVVKFQSQKREWSIDETDLEILNQILSKKYSRRAIQKSTKKDMNEIVKRLKRLEEKKIIFDKVEAILPGCQSNLTLLIQDKSKQNKDFSFSTWLKHLCYHLPYSRFYSIEGTFTGSMIQSKMPYGCGVEISDLLNRFISYDIDFHIAIGTPIFENLTMQLPLDKWRNNNWEF